MTAVIERAIAYNARCLGEEPTIGLHVLKDGRARIYDLDKGFRRQPHKTYTNVRRAYEAAIQSVVDARRVRILLPEVGREDAIIRAKSRRRSLPWPYTDAAVPA